MTGLAFDPTPEVAAKGVEVLREVTPKTSRIAVLWNPDVRGVHEYLEHAQSAARTFGIHAQGFPVRSEDDLKAAFDGMRSARSDALLVFPDPKTVLHHRTIVDLAARHPLPAAYLVRQFAEAGGLVSYGPNLGDQVRRTAVYVDKILKGAKGADLPIEQPTTFELVINLKTAKALGLTIPPSLLARADQVIE
jgi:putative tryptophan/tyrosine transport system substrate-binding protein